MVVTFTCPAYENITFFGDVALRLLTMMGHSGTIPSALAADEVPEALARLRGALAMNEGTECTQNHRGSAVSMKHRALPLINLLQAAVQKQTHVSWKEGF